MANYRFKPKTGWWIHLSRYAHAKSGRPDKTDIENDKMVRPWVPRLSMGHRMQCVACKHCAHFEACRQTRFITEAQDYCLFRPGRFLPARNINGL